MPLPPSALPAFDRPIPADGYAWWYVDALSDDGTQGLALIAMLGSVFSPHYFAARRRGPADPLDHCALNVGVYRPGSRRWAMTERGRQHVQRAPQALQVGPSALRWADGVLTIDIDEAGAPLPWPLRGQVRVHTGPLHSHAFALDAAERHWWTPMCPHARVEVDLEAPALRWSGTGYLDGNHGSEPLERTFREWHWSRGDTANGASVLYDVERRDGSRHSLALAFDRAGSVQPFAAPPVAALPTPLWQVRRQTRADAGHRPQVLRTLEDGPFYARSVVSTQLGGEPVTMVHESLSLDRFKQRWVQTLLPVRAPRARH